jgi:hypothetical protein
MRAGNQSQDGVREPVVEGILLDHQRRPHLAARAVAVRPVNPDDLAAAHAHGFADPLSYDETARLALGEEGYFWKGHDPT